MSTKTLVCPKCGTEDNFTFIQIMPGWNVLGDYDPDQKELRVDCRCLTCEHFWTP